MKTLMSLQLNTGVCC